MKKRQFCSFWVGGRLFGIDVREVQEVTMPLPITVIRKAPSYVRGLVNLRGQLSTAIGLRELFGIEDDGHKAERMTVVCSSEAGFLSLLVDRIGDVLEFDEDAKCNLPNHVELRARDLVSGVYRLESDLLSVLEVKNIVTCLFEKNQVASEQKGA